jgi:hypothetical protein
VPLPATACAGVAIYDHVLIEVISIAHVPAPGKTLFSSTSVLHVSRLIAAMGNALDGPGFALAVVIA